MERHDPRRAVRCRARQPLLGLRRDLTDPLGGLLQTLDQGFRVAAHPAAMAGELAAGFRATASAWRATPSANPARSPLMRFTAAKRSSLRRRRPAPIDRARARTLRVRSASLVRVANPRACNRLAVRASETPTTRRCSGGGRAVGPWTGVRASWLTR